MDIDHSKLEIALYKKLLTLKPLESGTSQAAKASSKKPSGKFLCISFVKAQATLKEFVKSKPLDRELDIIFYEVPKECCTSPVDSGQFMVYDLLTRNYYKHIAMQKVSTTINGAFDGDAFVFVFANIKYRLVFDTTTPEAPKLKDIIMTRDHKEYALDMQAPKSRSWYEVNFIEQYDGGFEGFADMFTNKLKGLTNDQKSAFADRWKNKFNRLDVLKDMIQPRIGTQFPPSTASTADVDKQEHEQGADQGQEKEKAAIDKQGQDQG